MRTVRRGSSDGTDHRSRRSLVETKRGSPRIAFRCVVALRTSPTRAAPRHDVRLPFPTAYRYRSVTRIRLPAVSSSHAPSCVQDSVCGGGGGMDCCCRRGHAGALWTSYEGSEHENGARQLSPFVPLRHGAMGVAALVLALDAFEAFECTYIWNEDYSHMSSSGV